MDLFSNYRKKFDHEFYIEIMSTRFLSLEFYLK